MRKIMMFFVVLLLIIPAIGYAGDVRGYWQDRNRDGQPDTYVSPHQRSNPNDSRTDNYGYPGNLNPNTGRINPPSMSPRENYPSNPSPYENPSRRRY